MHKAALCLVVPMMLVATFAFSQTSSIQLSISQPENGDVVPRRLNVSGTSAGLGTNKIVLFVYSPPAKRWFFQRPPRISRKLSGISDLLAPDGTFIHPRAAERTKFCSAYNRPAPEAVTSAHGVGARMRAGLRASNRRARHLPMRYETGLPSSVIRFRTLHASTASRRCPDELRARRQSPTIDVYRKNAFSTRAC